MKAEKFDLAFKHFCSAFETIFNELAGMMDLNQ